MRRVSIPRALDRRGGEMKKRARLFALALGGALIGTQASLAAPVPTAHSETIEVRCAGGSGFIADANAFRGQKVEVTAFYRATGIVCRIFDAETGVLLYDPAA
jgi:hypothetical protein